MSAPESREQIRANIKLFFVETGVILGNVVYQTSNVLRNVVVLNDIHIDIVYYFSPASCAGVAFRTMCAESEWENKVAINKVIEDEKEFLYHIIKSVTMKCLTSLLALEGACGFLAANLYAKSVFDEGALVNIRVEKQSDEKLSGCIRRRSKTGHCTQAWRQDRPLAEGSRCLMELSCPNQNQRISLLEL
ncbi:hypothetical protein Cgig2_006948 [Carnegiea gigantea]|uniref:Coatomer beta subunit appendage platform domain-containing protein n=1 Tax=Carnegiea gigantea TaxID=171969 RepID=A0A9Q1QGN2_9CARY|nr:hypothetical protein Cgig2_006948 [Carnegiea gigantea]